MKTRLTCLILLLSALGLHAELTLPTVFTDHMVLQRGQAVPVWGKADPGATVTVEFAGQKKTAGANADGSWRIDLDPLKASAKAQKLIVTSSAGNQQSTINDVLVGEVWLCSGQSNMQLAMQGSENAEAAIAAANHPLIRLYKTPTVFSRTPNDKIDSAWTTCTPESAKGFSAVAYYFGKKLQEELGVPVGLLLSAWGGTRIEPWTPPCGFEGFDTLADIRKQIDPMPALDGNPKQARQFPTAIYNGMIHAHIPFAIKGAIWYQGEGNHREGMLYRDKTAALLKGWRSLWGYDFPYYLVQIAPYKYGTEDPTVLAEFWEAQAEIVKTVPHTGMAVVSDATTLENIHPPNKEVPGTRLALLALDNAYGKKTVSTGPTFEKMKKPLLGGNTLEIVFDSAEGLTTRDGKAPDWFEIVGEDGHFKPAQAAIKGSSVILSSPEVEKPVAMRFAWHKLATPNLMNAARLPAPAFRAGKAPEPKQPDLTQIPEMEGFKTVYQLIIPVSCGYATQAPEYSIDNSAKAGSFQQIAYLLELQRDGGELEYAFAAMDAFTDDIKKIGIPTVASGARFMQQVGGLTVRSNVDGIQDATNSDGGNIEFWPGNYGGKNTKSIPEASEKLWDFGDDPGDKIPGYSCMQIHHWKARQTVFSFNKFNNGTIDLGIGNSEGRTRDWTFASNGGTYTFRRLTIMVK